MDGSAPLLSWDDCRRLIDDRRAGGATIAFTNGCFDLLHVGHVRYLTQARALSDLLVVGINADASVRRIKGPGRPIVPAIERAEVLSALESVDAVVVFEEDTPQRLIEFLQPDVVAKGGDWPEAEIVGRDVARARGGRAVSVPYVPGVSTTEILARVGRIVPRRA
jgi:D-beta-D-heptose 7-phosphate kinase/D-beta-D-heptose 1-phosphate adenosyltransferase